MISLLPPSSTATATGFFAHLLQGTILLMVLMFETCGGTMHCLVSRPGYGLVSEECPSNTVACRIRIDNNAVEFYEYSPLYDRNQFVCVLKNEYGSEERSGCLKKRTGRVRCWCFGRSNCNSAENSKRLYEAFVGGDEQHFHSVVEQIDFSDLGAAGEEGQNEEDFLSPSAVVSTPPTTPKRKATTTTPVPTTRRITKKPTSSEVIKGAGASSKTQQRKTQKSSGSTILSASGTSTSSSDNENGLENGSSQLKAMRYSGRRGGGAKSALAGESQDDSQKVSPALLSKSGAVEKGSSSEHSSQGAMLIGADQSASRHQHRMHLQRPANEEVTTSEPPTSTRKKPKKPRKQEEEKEKPVPATPIKTEFDQKNHVHIIHVNAKDEYEHNVIGSQQFSDILSLEKASLEAQSASPGPELKHLQPEEDEDDVDDELEEESLEDDSATLDAIAMTPTLQHNQGDLRRSQRNDKGTDRNENGGIVEDSLEEYFDSAFYASTANGHVVMNKLPFCLFWLLTGLVVILF